MFSQTNELRREFGNVLWILKCVFSKYRVVLRVWKCVVDIEMFSNLHCVVTLMGHRISLIALFSLKFRLYNKIIK